MATIYEVSKLAGVSLATVSRVLNDSELVSEKTRRKVQTAMSKLDYRPNSFARSLASNRSDIVGVLVPELHGPFFGTLLSGIEAELRGAGKHAIIAVGHSSEVEELEGIEFLASRNCDALILHVDAVSDDYLVKLNTGATPIVLVNRLVAGMAESCISLDNEQGGYIAARILLDLGHRDIAYVSGPLWKHDAGERFIGHKRAMTECGLGFDERLFFEGDFHESGGINGIRHFLSHGAVFSAVVCGNDEMAAGALVVAQDEGLTVPGDLSIVGFDNVNFSRYLSPRLTTINYPMNDMGHMAARWILKHVYGKANLEILNVFEPTLQARKSVGSVSLTA